MKVALVLMLASTPAPAQHRCVTNGEAEAMAQVALPDIIRQTGAVCQTRLPAASLVRRSAGAFIDKYDAAADQAWPQARAAIAKLADPMITPLLASDYARPMITAIVTPLIVGRIAPQDCATIDRLVTQLAPLPPKNMASVIVTTLQYLRDEKAKGKNVAVPDLPLCAEGSGR